MEEILKMARHNMTGTFNASALTPARMLKFLEDAANRGCPENAAMFFRTYVNSETATSYVDISLSWHDDL